MSDGQKGSEISQQGLRLTALTIPQVAKVLSAAGGQMVSEDTVRQDIDAGAPVNPDGTVNLIHYAAWIVREIAGGD